VAARLNGAALVRETRSGNNNRMTYELDRRRLLRRGLAVAATALAGCRWESETASPLGAPPSEETAAAPTPSPPPASPAVQSWIPSSRLCSSDPIDLRPVAYAACKHRARRQIQRRHGRCTTASRHEPFYGRSPRRRHGSDRLRRRSGFRLRGTMKRRDFIFRASSATAMALAGCGGSSEATRLRPPRTCTAHRRPRPLSPRLRPLRRTLGAVRQRAADMTLHPSQTGTLPYLATALPLEGAVPNGQTSFRRRHHSERVHHLAVAGRFSVRRRSSGEATVVANQARRITSEPEPQPRRRLPPRSLRGSSGNQL
jgi:hypothetical protein